MKLNPFDEEEDEKKSFIVEYLVITNSQILALLQINYILNFKQMLT